MICDVHSRTIKNMFNTWKWCSYFAVCNKEGGILHLVMMMMITIIIRCPE